MPYRESWRVITVVMQSLVSVIASFYNQRRFVNQCVESILGQSYTNIELIAIDDGSHDDTLKRLQRYGHDPRMRIVSKENEGVAAARRDGLALANGEFVMFVDGDDYLLPDAVQKLVEIKCATGAELVRGRAVRKFPFHSRKMDYMPECPREILITQPELFDAYYVSFFGQNILPVNI